MSNPFDLEQLLGSLTQGLGQVQEALSSVEVEGQAGGGLVKVRANGRMELLSVEIAPEATEELALLEDLVTAAANDALRRARAAVAERLSSLTGGLPLPPGLF